MPDALQRYVEAQHASYDQALSELAAGQKRTHWMWYIFPQIAGLGSSTTAQYYAIENLAEARAYLADPVLGARLAACVEALLTWVGRRTAEQVLGRIDAAKCRSSLTLFEAAGGGAIFGRALDAFYDSRRDPLTLELLNTA